MLAPLLSVLYFTLTVFAHRKLLTNSDSAEAVEANTGYSDTINVRMDYTWQINSTIESYQIEYESIASYIRSLIQQPEYGIESIMDQTEHKQDLMYHNTSVNDKTKTWLTVMEVRLVWEDFSTQLTDYVKSKMADDIRSKYDNRYIIESTDSGEQKVFGFLKIIDVKCDIGSIDGEERDITWLIAGFILGIICSGVVCICLVCIWIGGLDNDLSNDKASNEEYINDSASAKNNGHDPFISGKYSGYLKKYGKSKCYRMNEFELLFIDGVVTGSGRDDVGDYIIMGIYSEHTQRMAIYKTYTKDQLGDTVQIRLEYNIKASMWQGDWYAKVHKNEGHASGKWMIKLCSPLIMDDETKTDDYNGNSDYHQHIEMNNIRMKQTQTEYDNYDNYEDQVISEFDDINLDCNVSMANTIDTYEHMEMNDMIIQAQIDNDRFMGYVQYDQYECNDNVGIQKKNTTVRSCINT